MPAVTADTAAAVEGGAVPFKRGKKKLLIIVAAALVLVLAAGGGGVWVLKKKAAHAAALAAGDDEAASAEGTQPAVRSDAKSIPVYLPLDPFIVNLADKDVDRYAQIGITLELESNAASEQIKAYMPAIRNAILMILANKTSKELLYREGKELLAQEILREAVRPMGIDISTPEPVTPAPTESASAAASSAAAAASKPKARRGTGAQRNPIVRVHFASFIIQ